VLNLDVIAEELSNIGESHRNLEARIAEVERLNARPEDAALTTARALGEISRQNAVYEAMRRAETIREDEELTSPKVRAPRPALGFATQRQGRRTAALLEVVHDADTFGRAIVRDDRSYRAGEPLEGR
jgi:CRISPR/Cas system CSM-associated protein Csm2 small subunit